MPNVYQMDKVEQHAYAYLVLLGFDVKVDHLVHRTHAEMGVYAFLQDSDTDVNVRWEYQVLTVKIVRNVKTKN